MQARERETKREIERDRDYRERGEERSRMCMWGRKQMQREMKLKDKLVCFLIPTLSRSHRFIGFLRERQCSKARK